jgi:hypothetical protein
VLGSSYEFESVPSEPFQDAGGDSVVVNRTMGGGESRRNLTRAHRQFVVSWERASQADYNALRQAEIDAEGRVHPVCIATHQTTSYSPTIGDAVMPCRYCTIESLRTAQHEFAGLSDGRFAIQMTLMERT